MRDAGMTYFSSPPLRSLSHVNEHFSAVSLRRRDSHAGHVLAHPGRRATRALVRTFAILAYRYRRERLSIPNRVIGDEAGSVTKQFLHFILPLVELVDQLRHAAITPYHCVHAATPYAWGDWTGSLDAIDPEIRCRKLTGIVCTSEARCQGAKRNLQCS